jgi:hypothetical protein
MGNGDTFMSTASSAVTPVQLTWIRSNLKGRYELTANGPIVGSLQRVGFWKSASRAEFKGQSWSFQRKGLGSTQIFQEPGAQHVAEFKANWLGGGILTFADGQQFRLATKGLWRPAWSWLNNYGQTLVDVTPDDKRVFLVSAAESRYLPVLIMLSWHQILQSNDDVASVIAASAVAG